MPLKDKAANMHQTSHNFAGERCAVSWHVGLIYSVLSRGQASATAFRRGHAQASLQKLDAQNRCAISTRQPLAHQQWVQG